MFYDVLIAGGGIVGCAVARELSRYQLQIALCEKEAEVSFGTTKANSGIIHGGHHTDPATLKGRLEWEGNRLWDDLGGRTLLWLRALRGTDGGAGARPTPGARPADAPGANQGRPRRRTLAARAFAGGGAGSFPPM